MFSKQTAIATSSTSSSSIHWDQDDDVRDIHAVSPPQASIFRSSSLSTPSEGTEIFSTMSREFSAMVVAGAAMGEIVDNSNLDGIREEEDINLNELAIVPDVNSVEFERDPPTIQSVKKEEIETKINAWQNSKVAKINNRFKCEEAIIRGWENDHIDKATSRMKKIQRKLEEKRAKAEERMQNEIASAHRKAEEKRASAEGKRGTKVAKVIEKACLMKALGRPHSLKRSLFCS